MEKTTLRVLIGKFKSGTISDEELKVLKEYLCGTESEDALDEYAREEAEERFSQSPISEDRKDQMFYKLWATLNQDSPTIPINRHKRWIKVLAGCAAAAVLAIGFLFLFELNKTTPKEELSLGINETPIKPGGSKAKLLLEDGHTIDLEAIKSDTIIHLEKYSIRKSKNGDISYLVNSSSVPNEPLYNTIVTPVGGEYKLNLPDGTKIWINASSKLRYPLTFSEEEREVELTGEAYFEVAKLNRNGHHIPFLVYTNEQILEVLGTTFNINSYSKNIRTTLVEGKVRLNYPNGPKHVLSPNQQAIYSSESKKVQIEQIDPFYVTSWKNGSFAFENTALTQVMETLSRWYDVEVSYQTDVSALQFTGTISKYEQIQKILKVIELTGVVKFKIEGRRIKVM